MGYGRAESLNGPKIYVSQGHRAWIISEEVGSLCPHTPLCPVTPFAHWSSVVISSKARHLCEVKTPRETGEKSGLDAPNNSKAANAYV